MPEPIDMAAVEKVRQELEACAMYYGRRANNENRKRLDAAGQALLTLIRSIIAERDRLKAENERLRAALRELYSYMQGGCCDRSFDEDRIMDQAKAALASAPEPSTGSKKQ